ncbi:hypothetical protein O3M35_006002 [Rhynocoris fuscipes]|uniref:Uncharacterized protein n=1 Tax=Rhynocoris fuscipes TaxID=488301 RepID=A0AAW1DEA0_9HEMI
MDAHLGWDQHINILCNKLSSVVYQIRNVSGQFDESKIVYFSLFELRLKYGICVYGNSPQCLSLFLVQKRATRALHGVKYPGVSCRTLFANKISYRPRIIHPTMPHPCV